MQFRSKIQKMLFIALISSLAVVLSYLERFIPLPGFIPGMKLGLANIMTVAALYYFSNKDVFTIVILRIFVSLLIAGNVVGFIYSLAGGLLSFAGMALLLRYFQKWVSPIGVSVFGAFLHNVAQLSVLGIIMHSVTISISYSPIIIFTSLATGFFVGLTANLLNDNILNQFMVRIVPQC